MLNQKLGLSQPLITLIALPKGRISNELDRILNLADISPEPAFYDDSSRRLKFQTNVPGLEFVRARSSDIPTLVGNHGVSLGICGSDTIMERKHEGIRSVIDLQIGKCRLSAIAHSDFPYQDLYRRTALRVATKYPNIVQPLYAARHVNVEIVKMSGCLEIAPLIGISDIIVDLVETGNTIRQNDLFEHEKLLNISSHLICSALPNRNNEAHIDDIIDRFSMAATSTLLT